VEKCTVGEATYNNMAHALCVEKWGNTPGSVGPNFDQVPTVCSAEISRKTIHYYCHVHTGRPFDTLCSYPNSADICTHHLIKCKGFPQQVVVAQGVPGRLRTRIFLTFRHYKGGRSSAKRTDRLYPRRNPWYSLFRGPWGGVVVKALHY
jgi:hypothetical protein